MAKKPTNTNTTTTTETEGERPTNALRMKGAEAFGAAAALYLDVNAQAATLNQRMMVGMRIALGLDPLPNAKATYTVTAEDWKETRAALWVEFLRHAPAAWDNAQRRYVEADALHEVVPYKEAAVQGSFNSMLSRAALMGGVMLPDEVPQSKAAQEKRITSGEQQKRSGRPFTVHKCPHCEGGFTMKGGRPQAAGPEAKAVPNA